MVSASLCSLHTQDKTIHAVSTLWIKLKKKQQREEAAVMSFSGKYASVFAHLEV